MKRFLLTLALLAILLAGCSAPDLNAPLPTYETGIDPNAWAKVPAGEFLFGQHESVETTEAFEMMITDVTVSQYTAWLTEALASGAVRVGEFNGKPAIVGYYPGDKFHGVKHEERIDPGDWVFIPLEDPASRFTFDGTKFAPKPGYENHPMTNVSWFGAWAYCGVLGGRLPTEMEWEKAARSSDGRPFPWARKSPANTPTSMPAATPLKICPALARGLRRLVSTTAKPTMDTPP